MRSKYPSVKVAFFKVIRSFGTDKEVLNFFLRKRWVAVPKISISIVLPMLDSASDLLLLYEWMAPGKRGEDYWFGCVSLGIIITSVFIPAVVMLFIALGVHRSYMMENSNRSYIFYHPENGFFHPLIGFFLSIVKLRLPVTAAIQAYDVIKNGVDDKYLRGPARITNNVAEITSGPTGRLLKVFTPGLSIILALKLFELMGETTLELVLQTSVHSSPPDDLLYYALPSVCLTRPRCSLARHLIGTKPRGNISGR